MEGFLLRKTDGFLRKKWVKKYFILDVVGHSIAVFGEKPEDLDDHNTNNDENNQNGTTNDDDTQVPVEEVIDFLRIDQVNYLRTKSKGKRFEITFFQKKEDDAPDYKGVPVTYSLAAPTQRAARKWVKSIITAVAIQKSRNLGTRRESKPQYSEGKRRSRSGSRQGRRTTAQLDANLSPTSIEDQKKSEIEDDHRSNSADQGQQAGFAAIPVGKLSIDLHQDEIWKQMLSPISPSATGSRSGSARGGSHKHSRRNIVFSHDREVLLHLIESSPLKSSTPTKKSLKVSGTINRNRKQIVISPFKQALWDLLMLISYRHSRTIEINLRERTISAIHSVNDPDAMLEHLLRKTLGIFNDPNDEDSNSDVDLASNTIGSKELIDAISEEKFNADDFEVIVPVDYTPRNYSSFEVHAENIYFWIVEMKKTEISGGIPRIEKPCVLMVRDHEVVGLKHGKAWHPKFLAFKGADMIDWLRRSKVCASEQESLNFAQKAVGTEYVSLILQEDSSQKSCFDPNSFFYFTTDLLTESDRLKKANKTDNESHVDSKRNEVDDKTKSRDLESKDAASDEELSISLQAAQSVSSENEEEMTLSESFVSIVTSKPFIDFFCCLPNDGSILRLILLEMNSETRLPMRTFLSEWKSFLNRYKPGSKDFFSERNDLKVTLLKQALYELVMEYHPLLRGKVVKVFVMDDSESHGLGVDLYWELLKKQLSDRHMCSSSLQCSICSKVDEEFVYFAEKHLFSAKYSTEPVMRSLIGTLLDEVWYSVKPLPFNNNVVRPGIWKAFFIALTNSDERLFNDCLQDAFSLLLDNKKNAFDICAQKGWVKWMVPYGKKLFLHYWFSRCFLVPVLQGLEYSNSLLINIISRIVFHVFFDRDDFAQVLVETLIDIESCSPILGSEFTLLTAYNIMQALIGSIASGAKIRFPSNPSKYSSSHFNLKSLGLITMHFVFASCNYGVIPYEQKTGLIGSWKTTLMESYLQTRKEYGLHTGYRKFARRMLRTLSSVIKALHFNTATLGGIKLIHTPSELSTKAAFEREMTALGTELSDCESFLSAIQAAEEQLNHSAIESAPVEQLSVLDTVKLSDDFMKENVKKFYTGYGEKKTGFLAFVLPDLLSEEIYRISRK